MNSINRPPTNHSPRRGCSFLRLLGVALFAFFVSAGKALPDDIFWDAPLGGWNTRDNWDPRLVPETTDVAIINNGGTSIVSSAAFAQDLIVGSNVSSTSGNLEIENSAVLQVANSAELGRMSSGSISIDGGFLSVQTGNFHIANAATVTGTQQLLTLQNGGIVEVQQGQTVVGAALRSVNVLIDGNGSQLTTTAAPIMIDGNQTSVTLSDRGRLFSAGGTVGASGPGGGGGHTSIKVTGIGSEWRAISGSDPLSSTDARIAVRDGGGIRSTNFEQQSSVHSDFGPLNLEIQGSESGFAAIFRVDESAVIEGPASDSTSVRVADEGRFIANSLEIKTTDFRVENNGRLMTTNPVDLTNGSLTISGEADPTYLSAPSIQGTGDSVVNLSHNNSDYRMAPMLEGSLGLHVTSTGTTILDQENSYSGVTTVGGGATLRVEVDGALGDGIVQVNPGGRLEVPGSHSDAIQLSEGGELFAIYDPVAGQTTRITSNEEGEAGNTATDFTVMLDATQARSVEYSTSINSTASNDSLRLSNVFSIDGTGDDPFLVQITVDPELTDGSLGFVGWLDDLAWVPAINGNLGNNATPQQQNSTLDFAAFQEQFGSNLSNYVGAYGGCSTCGEVWAVVDHNSEFALITPEPSTAGLLFIAAFVFCTRRVKRGAS